MSPLIYEYFGSISRHVEKITWDIYLISRSLVLRLPEDCFFT